MKILYGTTNHAKLELMGRITKFLDFDIIGLKELNKQAVLWLKYSKPDM